MTHTSTSANEAFIADVVAEAAEEAAQWSEEEQFQGD
jgi:hypothetical protein